MKKWKVVIEVDSKEKELIMVGDRYSDVYIDVIIKYPECRIVCIIEI
jgi:hypothetical protein